MRRLGIIEGFFGGPWSWQERADALPFLQAHGFDAYLYAPKADRNLRYDWKTPHAEPVAAEIRAFGEQARAHGVSLGIGLSPLDLHASWDGEGQTALLRRVDELRELGVDLLGLFFDDMRGDVPRLALSQGEMATAVAARHPDLPLIMCPTYYTPHAVLDRVFGQRPEHYLRDLGEALPDTCEVFWTGEEVCSKTYDAADLQRVAEELGRPVAIWDNYPVNDGPRMCKHLHLRPPEGRDQELTDVVTSWWVNPMNQATLSRLPLASLAESFGRAPRRSLETRASDVLGDAGAVVLRWVASLQDDGLDVLTDDTRQAVLDDLACAEGTAATELRGWLAGDYIVGPECLTDTEA